MARRGNAVGNTRGGRGPLGTTIRNQGDYYRSGRSSAFSPGATVRDAGGNAIPFTGSRGGAKS